jgi:MFS family permease
MSAITTERPAVTTTNVPELAKVIGASAAGTMIEWYDFYIFGSLATVLAPKFYPQGNEVVAMLAFLATFATGFAVRPFGALVFGKVGDVVGRKYAFLVTLLLMGGATTAVGLVPTYASIGIAAPIILVLLRLVQGLALGGEYGGAAVYVAEHAPENRRGYYTSFIQTTATLGLFVSLAVILVVRSTMSKEAFASWGWRVPFLLSFLLVGLSTYVRSKLHESPVFTKMKAEGKLSKSPLKESARSWRVMLLVLFGAAAGQAVVWYTGQLYALYFLQSTLKVPFVTANIVVASALLLGLPFFVVFGALSDRIGRKKVMLTGNLLAALLFYPIFRGLHAFAKEPVILVGLIFVLVLLVTMVYGPIAAFLVEAFPPQIRYTSVSVPYHVANGYFGGCLPLIATALVAKSGNIYAGLVFPIGVALATAIIGTVLLKERTQPTL